MSTKKLILTNIDDTDLFKKVLNTRKYSLLSKQTFLHQVGYVNADLDEPSKKFLFIQEFEKEVRRFFYSKNIRNIVYKVDTWHPDVFAFLAQQYGEFRKFDFHTYLVIKKHDKNDVLEMSEKFPFKSIVEFDK